MGSETGQNGINAKTLFQKYIKTIRMNEMAKTANAKINY